MHSFACLADLLSRFGDIAVLGSTLQIGEDMIGAFNDRCRHACQFGYVNTEAMFRTTAYQFAQEDDLAVYLTHGDVVITNAFEGLLHLVQLVVVCGEECLRVPFVLVDIFHDCPCNRDAVVGAGASSEFVEEHQTAFGEVVKNRCRFVHLHHEG